MPLDDENRREVFVGASALHATFCLPAPAWLPNTPPPCSGRVVEDRRFGIYDARRYRVQSAFAQAWGVQLHMCCS